ncbi:MAG TPA: protein kinase, partial [Candidatus Limnocylindria bacterium]|nr:protein kinase [Candidatus Limnocylindria bacterium]
MIGRLISGRYRLIAPLGEGGMATIWRAVDEQLDREVAVKILRPQFSADPGFAARFKQEARAAGGLSHPNIVSVYDYGTDGADGEQYIVMELVEGRDLASIISERGALSVDDSVRVAIAVASALEAAHRKGIVHRDVKPGNILITDHGDVKVTDFGIARAVSEASMTVTGTTLGSVHYFSPEQARGDEVTGASDVYALGIVLFEMLTGRRPFEGDSAAAVALKRLNEDAPTPSGIGRPVPAGLEAILARALAREPIDRFPDAGALAEALRVWRRDPDAVPGVVPASASTMAGAAAAAPVPAGTPPAGEPTVYVPPRVARPADRVPVAPPPRRADVYQRPRDEGTPWWMWLLAVLAVFLLGAIGFLAVQLLGSGTPAATPSPTAATVIVPTCDDVSLATLRQQADELGVTVDTESEPSEDIDEGRVIRCDPETGQPV